jgi:hypothetical protein
VFNKRIDSSAYVQILEKEEFKGRYRIEKIVLFFVGSENIDLF